MNPDLKKSTLTRESILGLLSDAEIAKVSEVEDGKRLIEGDEYVDLLDPGAGVQQVQAKARGAVDHALPRSAVSEASWAKIVDAVAGRGPRAEKSRPH